MVQSSAHPNCSVQAVLTQDLSLHSLIVFPFYNRNRHTPCQISRDRTRPHARLQPGINQFPLRIDHRIRRPFSIFPGLPDPLLDLWLESVELDVHVGRRAGRDGVRLADKAAGIDQVYSIEGAAAHVALITTSVLEKRRQGWYGEHG